MNILRRLGGILLALALTAVAVPALAQQKVFSLNMTPATSAASPALLTATFKNETPNGNSSFNSLELTAPTGLTITAVSTPPSGTAAIINGGQKVQVRNMSPVGRGQTFAFNVTVTAAACTTASGNWSAVPWTGSDLSGNTFALVVNKSSLGTSVTGGLGNLSLQFVFPPATVNKDGAFDVTVKQVSSCGPTVTPPPVPITLTGAPAFIAGARTTSGSQATFTGNTFGQLGTASMNATTTTAGYASALANLTVVTAAGNLGCENVVGPSNQFNGTPGGGTNPAQTGYFSGYRAPDWKSNCPPVQYTITNNIEGTGPVVDANGFILPKNTTAINYAAPTTVGVLLAHTITFAPVRSGIDQLPHPNKIVKYCKNVVSSDCSNPLNLVAAVGCTSTVVDQGSIPSGHPGCIRGAAWVIIPSTASNCPAVNPLATVPEGSVCIQHQIDILEKQDPPWGMTDE